MGSADYLDPGNWNIRCDACGRKLKGTQAKTMWNGLKVCPEHWEPRHPQDFVRAVPDNPAPPFVRNPPDIFVNSFEYILQEVAAPNTPPFDIDFDHLLTEDGSFIITES